MSDRNASIRMLNPDRTLRDNVDASGWTATKAARPLEV